MGGVEAAHIWKAYNGRTVLGDVTFRVPSGGRRVLWGPSGSGKTTLLRLCLRLEVPDRGTVTGPDRWAAVFQEDRLLDQLDGWDNLRLVLGRDFRAESAWNLLSALGLGDAVCLGDASCLLDEAEAGNAPRPPDGPEETRRGLFRRRARGNRVRDYSGGMRRRLALARALLSPADAIALDEPFTGLDEDSRRRCVEAVARLGAGRTILLASHDPRDASDLGAEILDLSELNRQMERKTT